jgi:hypothetical protein
MGLDTNKSNSDYSLIILKIAGLKKGETVRLDRVEKLDEAWVVTGDHYQCDGFPTGIKVKEFTMADGTVVRKIQIWMQDHQAKQTILLEGGFNSMTRSIINSLLSIKDDLSFGKISFSFYTAKKSGMPAVWIENDGEKVGWSMEYADFNKAVVKTKDVDENGEEFEKKNYAKVDKIIREEHIPAIDDKIKLDEPGKDQAPEPSQEAPKPVDVEAVEQDDEELPF